MEFDRLSRALGEYKVVGDDHDEADRVVKSAGRVLQILELFDVLKREALVSEVSELLGFPQSSTSALLRSLVVMGYLSFNAQTRAFAPTTRVALLGSWVNGPLLGDGPLVSLLHRLNVRTGQAVVLAVRNQIWSQYIHVVQAISPVRLFVVKGSRRPLVRSGTGLTLLADLKDNEIKRIGTRYNAELEAGETKVCLTTLLEQVQAVKRNGYAFNFNTVTQGGGVIAMRLPRPVNEEQFSIGLAGSTEILRDNLNEFLFALREEIANHVSGMAAASLATQRCN
jgi:DNA-binding IclR family transcriptional regulator